MLSGLPEVLFLFLTPIKLLINNYTSIFSNNTCFNCPKNHTWKTYSTLSRYSCLHSSFFHQKVGAEYGQQVLPALKPTVVTTVHVNKPHCASKWAWMYKYVYPEKYAWLPFSTSSTPRVPISKPCGGKSSSGSSEFEFNRVYCVRKPAIFCSLLSYDSMSWRIPKTKNVTAKAESSSLPSVFRKIIHDTHFPLGFHIFSPISAKPMSIRA